MPRRTTIFAILLLATGWATLSSPALAQRHRSGPMGRAPAARPPKQRPEHPQPSATPKTDKTSPAHAPIEAFARMAPEERQKVLASLTPERAEKLRKQLNDYSNMTPQQQTAARELLNAFSNLPPERQEKLRKAFSKFAGENADRQQEMRQELNQLRGLPEAERKARLNSAEFKDRFNNNERKIVREMSDLLPNE